jgi:two-component system sensor histidine kinase KdpD
VVATLARLTLRCLLSLAGVSLVTLAARALVPVNPTTTGFAYLLIVLLIASTWGFVEALVGSVAATLAFNYFLMPPVGTFTIADPQNWVALFSFLATALIASRLSAKAERRARDAIERQRDVERLYTFSRSILLIDSAEPFARQLVRRLVEVFELDAALLYDRRTGEIIRAGPAEFDGLDDQLRDAAQSGACYLDAERRRVIAAVRLGSEPIASIGLQGTVMPDSVVQGIANLVAIGLERARAQDLAREVEVARQSEQLRTTLIDAMAHELKTPLTAIKAATTSLLSGADQPMEVRKELLAVADEEAAHLQELIDDSIEMARLDKAHIDVELQPSHIEEVLREAVASLPAELAGRLELVCSERLPELVLDRRLLRLALRQLVDNALKYSPPASPVRICIHGEDGRVAIEITDRGEGIPLQEQRRIFERFYRSPSVSNQIPGSGLGLSIAASIVRAHKGELDVESRPGQTTFRLTLPAGSTGGVE